ncbi:MAG TPA: DEAD/DEAH box helicase [Rhizomicrobium sp.]|nr:DEAD/DEAH box helicase [Rhizomicrobium sp.]
MSEVSLTDTSETTPETAPATPNGFAALGLSADLLKAVEQSGYTTPTPIQAEGIPEVLKRRDVIGIAQTGTGKTASFTLPMIELLARGRAKARMPRSLILEPTRELAAQVAESFEKYGKYNKLSMALLIGGTSFEDQDRKLDRGVDVLIATPGRLLDHFGRGKLMLSQVQILVVDEADRMLDMGFIPDVEEICKKLPFTRQTLFYSATMPPEIQRLTEKFLHNPVRVEVARPATTAANITQEVIHVPANDWAKREALRRLIRDNAVKNAIVFCNRKTDVDIVAKSLAKHGFNAAPLHGDLDQSVRTRTLDGFRAGTLDFLVASDVAARGLDIPAVGHVFNFDAPYHPDDYVHRIGRTGRAGRSGHTYMLMTPRDAKYVEAIEKLIGKKFEARKLEGLSEAVEARPARDDRKGGDRNRNRSRERGRGDRDRKREYPIKPHGHVASMEPAAPVAAAPVTVSSVIEQAAPPQSKQQPRHDHRQDHRQKQTHQQQQRPPKPQAQQRPQEPEPDLRSQLPAFLLRPVPLPKAPEKPAPRPKKTKDSAEA